VNVDRESWYDRSGCSIETANGSLAITANPFNHAAIAELLKELAGKAGANR
jgi:hypothetical protein